MYFETLKQLCDLKGRAFAMGDDLLIFAERSEQER